MLVGSHQSGGCSELFLGGIVDLDIDKVLVSRHNNVFARRERNIEAVLLLVGFFVGDSVDLAHLGWHSSRRDTIEQVFSIACDL